MRYKDLLIKNLEEMKPRDLAKWLNKIVVDANCHRCAYFKAGSCTVETKAKPTCEDGVTKWLKKKV